MNTGKIEFIAYNQTGAIKTKGDHPIKRVTDFSYLGSNITSAGKDVDIRKAKAWKALDSRRWKSSLPRQQQKSLDGTYTQLLRAALNVSWKRHITNRSLYGHLAPISVVITE